MRRYLGAELNVQHGLGGKGGPGGIRGKVRTEEDGGRPQLLRRTVKPRRGAKVCHSSQRPMLLWIFYVSHLVALKWALRTKSPGNKDLSFITLLPWPSGAWTGSEHWIRSGHARTIRDTNYVIFIFTNFRVKTYMPRVLVGFPGAEEFFF